jgi:zinc transporter
MTKQPQTADPKQKGDGLVFACRLDGAGGAEPLDWPGVLAWKPEDGPIWIHLDRRAPAATAWLDGQKAIPAEARTALLARETRPRAVNYEEGTMVILRGINHNTGEEPDDMVALRIWVEEKRIVSLRHRRLMTPRAIHAEMLEKGGGPQSSAEVLVQLADRLTEQMNDIVTGLDDQLDEIEEKIEVDDITQTRSQLGEIRQSCVGLRRYVAPQREALSVLRTDPPSWIGKALGRSLRESEDRLLRYVEELDAARDRAVVIRDEIANRLSEDMNRTMYALSVIAGIFLPLGLLTGLLGINVGGMPGVENSWAFWITCVLLAALAVAEVWLFRRLKWI